MTKQDEQFREDMLDFKAQMLKFVEVSNQKFNGLISDVQTNGFKLEQLETEMFRGSSGNSQRFDSVETKLAIIREQVRMVDVKANEIAGKVVGIEKRLKVIEAQLDLMETKLTSLEDEIRQIRLELDELNETTNIITEMKDRFAQIEARVLKIEEKLLT